MAREIFPDPDGCQYTHYLAGHPAWLHTAEGVRDQVQSWMRDDPQHYPPHEPHDGEDPDALLSADDLQYRADHPGADSLLPLLARLCGRPVALVTRPNRRYAPPAPAITVYWPSDHLPHRAEV